MVRGIPSSEPESDAKNVYGFAMPDNISSSAAAVSAARLVLSAHV